LDSINSQLGFFGRPGLKGKKEGPWKKVGGIYPHFFPKRKGYYYSFIIPGQGKLFRKRGRKGRVPEALNFY